MSFNVRYFVKVSLLSAIAFVLMLLEFPLPFFPAFLKIDFSDLPALLGGFALGPVAAVSIELVKNLLHLVVRGHTAGVGELANFLVGVAFVLPASFAYLKTKTRKGAMLGMGTGIVAMTVFAVLANYYIFIPLYSKFLPPDFDIKAYILYAVIPFNILKSLIVSVITLLIYKKLSPILHR